MTIAHALDPGTVPDRPAELARLRQILDESGTVPGRRDAEDQLRVPRALSALLPEGLPRGSALGLDGDLYLAAALVGAAVSESGCAALVGAGDIGIEAIAAAGAPLEHLVLVDAPGEAWVDAVEALINAVDVLLLCPPSAPSPGLARRIAARLRRGAARTALLIAGAWPAPVRLHVAQVDWWGLSAGHGQLQARRATVTAQGRASWARERAVNLWLPARDGTVKSLDEAAPTAPSDRPRLTLVRPNTAA